MQRPWHTEHAVRDSCKIAVASLEAPGPQMLRSEFPEEDVAGLPRPFLGRPAAVWDICRDLQGTPDIILSLIVTLIHV